MASFRQHGKKNKICHYRYVDAAGKHIERKGHWDFKTAQGMARRAEDEVAKIRNGLVSPQDAAYVRHESRPLADHIADWQAALVAQGFTTKHAEHTSNRVRRLVSVIPLHPCCQASSRKWGHRRLWLQRVRMENI